MRKRVIEQGIDEDANLEYNWFNLEALARAEISSEADGHPIEAALVPGSESYWQAGTAGEQTLRLLFDEPQHIRVIRLLFQADQDRTQEFVLRWSADAGELYHDIARQQYNFSSPDSTQELETYNVDLQGVTALELSIIPDISGGNARARLCEWRIA